MGLDTPLQLSALVITTSWLGWWPTVSTAALDVRGPAALVRVRKAGFPWWMSRGTGWGWVCKVRGRELCRRTLSPPGAFTLEVLVNS